MLIQEEKPMIIDADKLREDMVNYYGTAMFGGLPMAMMDLSRAENASDEELVRMALDNNVDLSKYEV